MKRIAGIVGVLMLASLWLSGCAKKEEGSSTTSSSPSGTLSGKIIVDGSSTVLPISEAMAEEFQKLHPNVTVAVGKSGTGGGFKKFANGEIDIAGASRPIREEEDKACKQNGIEYVEIPIAYDALAVVVNPKNNWCDSLTVSELKKIWAPESRNKITNWSQVRSGFPNKSLQLFGPGTDSGTFDYFTAAVVGKEKASRPDYTASEDDNILVQGVASNEGGLGYFGVAYYIENRDRLKAVAIDDENPNNGNGAFLPTEENVLNGTYQPLARPLFLYVSLKALERPEVREFVLFCLNQAPTLTREAGYIPLPDKIYTLSRERVERRITGSVFGAHGSQVGVKLEDLYKVEEQGEHGAENQR